MALNYVFLELKRFTKNGLYFAFLFGTILFLISFNLRIDAKLDTHKINGFIPSETLVLHEHKFINSNGVKKSAESTMYFCVLGFKL